MTAHNVDLRDPIRGATYAFETRIRSRWRVCANRADRARRDIATWIDGARTPRRAAQVAACGAHDRAGWSGASPVRDSAQRELVATRRQPWSAVGTDPRSIRLARTRRRLAVRGRHLRESGSRSGRAAIDSSGAVPQDSWFPVMRFCILPARRSFRARRKRRGAGTEPAAFTSNSGAGRLMSVCGIRYTKVQRERQTYSRTLEISAPGFATRVLTTSQEKSFFFGG